MQPAGRSLVAEEKHFRVIFSDFGRISCDFRLDIRDFGKKCEIKGNKQGNLEAAVKGNSHGGLAGMQPVLYFFTHDDYVLTVLFTYNLPITLIWVIIILANLGCGWIQTGLWQTGSRASVWWAGTAVQPCCLELIGWLAM